METFGAIAALGRAAVWLLPWLTGQTESPRTDGARTVLVAFDDPKPARPDGAEMSGSPERAPAEGDEARAAATALIEGTRQTEAESDKAQELVEKAAVESPDDVSLMIAYAVVLTTRGEHDKAVALAERATKAEPGSSRAWYWRGQTMFNKLAVKRDLSALDAIDAAKEACQKAIELDGAYSAPRVALAMFYINAPGIVGGSYRKAREQGRALEGIKGAEPMGAMVLAMTDAADDEWTNAAGHFAAWERAAPSPRDKASAVLAYGRALLTQREKPKEALPVIERALAMSEPDQRAGALYLLGETKRKLGDTPAAIAAYREVLSLNPEARRTRLALAECLEKTGDKKGAAQHYAEYATRFPSDEGAKDAAKKAERLRR